MSNKQVTARLGKTFAPAICAVTLLTPGLVWLISVGNPLEYFTNRVPAGQALYVTSKLCGMLALALFWLQGMTALARFSPALRGFVHLNRTQHVWLGVATFLLVSTHLILFISATSVRAGHLTISLLAPQFGNGFFNTFVSLGAIAFWLLCAVLIAGWQRSRGRTSWQWVHQCAFLAFGLAFLHGISIGSETRFGLMAYVYAFIGLSLSTAVCSWIWFRLRSRSGLEKRIARGGSVGAASGSGSIK